MDNENSLLSECLHGIFLLPPDIFIDFDHCSISVCETEFPLTAREVELFILLVKYPHRYHSTSDLARKIARTTTNYEISEHSIEQTISSLRRKLGEDGKKPRFIASRRSYLMYIALKSMPASFSTVGGSPGEETYDINTPSNSYTTSGDLANVLNWEASGHTSTSNYQQYGDGFYAVVGGGNLDLTTLQNDVSMDIHSFNVPLVASVKGGDLPDWNNKNSAATHFISIINYDSGNSTFTYAETCGADSAGSDTQGYNHYAISQQGILNAIYDAGNNGGIVWQNPVDTNTTPLLSREGI